MGKFQMWITRRIGKNDGKKTAMDWLLFFQKCTKKCMTLSDTYRISHEFFVD